MLPFLFKTIIKNLNFLYYFLYCYCKQLIIKNMKKNYLNLIDRVIMIFFYLIFSPFVLMHAIACCIISCNKILFEKVLNPIYTKLCIIIRGPIPNSTVHVKGPEDNYFNRVNDKLLTIKEAKKLGKEYENKGYEVYLNLSEF